MHPSKETRTLIVAHRGACHAAPENTLAAARLAFSLGADFVETDVRTTKDGVFVLMHDSHVNRTSNGKGRVARMDSSRIRQLDAGMYFDTSYAGEKIPLLTELFALCGDNGMLYLDIKKANPLQLKETVLQAGMQHRVFFGFWNRFQLKNFRKTCPEMKIKMKIARKASLPRLIRKYNPAIAEIPYRRIDSGLIKACHDAGIMVMVYQKKNDAEKYRKIAASGVDIINLNHIELFLTVVLKSD